MVLPALVVGAWRVEPDADRRLAILFDPAHDPAAVALLEAPAPHPPGEAGAAGTATFVRRGRDVLEIAVWADRDALLVVGLLSWRP